MATVATMGYLQMAVRSARHARFYLGRGQTFLALNQLCWAWRYLGCGRQGPAASYRRAHRAVDRVMDEFVELWPLRHAQVRTDIAELQAGVGRAV